MCEVCGKIIGHDYRCPYYMSPKATCYCSYCKEGIFNGEKYIKKYDGEYVHYDCLEWVEDLMDWAGYEIKTMED